MESSLGPGPGGEAGRRGPQWALGPAHTWRGGCGQRAHEAWGTCGLLRPGSRVDRAVPWAPCPSHGGARAGSCLSWKLGLAVRLSAALAACGPAGRPTGHEAPPHPLPRSGSPPACPPMAMPRCVPPGLSALRRCDVCWSAPRSRGGAGGAQQVWRVAPTPPGDGRLCLWPQGPWGWQVGPSTGRRGVGGDQGDFFQTYVIVTGACLPLTFARV